jgi:hypothetical protein
MQYEMVNFTNPDKNSLHPTALSSRFVRLNSVLQRFASSVDLRQSRAAGELGSVRQNDRKVIHVR